MWKSASSGRIADFAGVKLERAIPTQIPSSTESFVQLGIN
jgi:hypothetical protein